MENTRGRHERPKRGLKRVGLSLSGGAVRGMAHLGVVKVLEEHGIPVDVVAGTSAGAFAGAFLAAGVPCERLLSMATLLDWGKISSMNVRGLGLLKSANMARFIEQVVGKVAIEDLPKPYAAMAVGLTTGRLVAFTEGPLAPAVMASTAIPGVFAPVEIDGELYVDGGVKAFDPVDQVRAMGAEYVISVKLVPPEGQRAKPRNVLELILTTFDLNTAHIAALEPAGDTTIVPDLTRTNAFDFKQTEDLIERGAEAARAKIEEIERGIGMRSPLRRIADWFIG